jgi:hypothetical protein
LRRISSELKSYLLPKTPMIAFCGFLENKAIAFNCTFPDQGLHGQQELKGNRFPFVIKPNVIESGMSEAGQKSIRQSK